jgi:AcrR family transcriptional regulator
MDPDTARIRLLEAADELFYTRGIQAVGMDAIRDASGVSLKRLYQVFPAKEQLIEAYLDHRDAKWRGRLAEHVAAVDDTQERILAVFDWLRDWFGQPSFRGCAWINAFGELGAMSDAVAEAVRRHKSLFREYLQELLDDAGYDAPLVDALFLLAEGAMTTAGIFKDPAPAEQAKATARQLLEVGHK